MSEYDHNTHLLCFLNGRQPQIETHHTLITENLERLQEEELSSAWLIFQLVWLILVWKVPN